jgi:SNF2 family DNA or RNA helicase
VAPRKHCQVGEKIYHEDYGEGMVVEVRPRPFFDILEVAFADGVRRLNSNHPKITEQRTVRAAEKPAGPARRRVRPARESSPGPPSAVPQGTEAVGSAVPAAEDEVQEEAEEEVDTGAEPAVQDNGLHFLNPESLALDAASVEEILNIRHAPKDQGRGFVFQLQAERLSLTRGFENLLALSAVRDLQRYDFQIQACLRVLRQMRGRAILADEVGLGKTIEAGLILKEYVTRGLVRRALVLTPVSLMTQWREELLQKFDLPFEVRARGQGWGEVPFLIASIDTAKTEKNRDDIGAAQFDLLVVDEAHRLRNHLTQGWKFVDALSLKYLLLLTATPVQNDLRELFNLVTLLKPGLLGTYRSFRREFMVRGDKRLPKNTRQLARTLSRVMVRTSRSSTALVFPKREVFIIPFDMSKEERRLYDGVADFVREVAEESDPKDFPRWHFLLLVLQKEMGSCSWAAVKTLERSRRIFKGTPFGRQLGRLAQIGRAITVNAKVEGLRSLVKEIPDEKVIVFTQFRRTLEFLEAVLRKDGHDPAIFHGSLAPAEKDRQVEEFRGAKRIFLSTEAGGEGRNLQFCRTMVNFDLPWNPMRIEQRIGRIHRLGQTRDTRIYNFTTNDTVEDHVLNILHQKIQMFELVVGEMDMVLGHWSDRDSFESEIFRIWAGFRDARQRREAFDKLGEDMLLARKRHERVKEFDDSIFSRLDSSLGTAHEEGAA